MAIGLIGFGDLGRQMLEWVDPDRRFDRVCFDDEWMQKGGEGARPFVEYADPRFSEFDFYVCLGYRNLALRKQVVDELRERGRSLPCFVHPTVHLHSSASLGPASVLYPMCNVDQRVQIGAGVLLNNSVTISHDSVVGDASYLSPGVVLSGYVRVGERSFLGSGTLVADHLQIGADVRVGIGTVVTREVPDGASVVGNQMRLVERGLRLFR